MKNEKKPYENAEIEIVAVNEDDTIRTSPTIELPWLPLEENSETL